MDALEHQPVTLPDSGKRMHIGHISDHVILNGPVAHL